MFNKIYSDMMGSHHEIDFEEILTPWVNEIVEFVLFGRIPEDLFVTSVLKDDFYTLCESGRSERFDRLPGLVKWVLKYVPAACFGSEEDFIQWHRNGGAIGLNWNRGWTLNKE
jgi:hypothetical protein